MDNLVIILAAVQLCMTLGAMGANHLHINGTRVRLNAVETEQRLIQRALASSSKLRRGRIFLTLTQTLFKVFLTAQVLNFSNNRIQLLLTTEILRIMEFTIGLGLYTGVYFLEQPGKAHSQNLTGKVGSQVMKNYNTAFQHKSVM